MSNLYGGKLIIEDAFSNVFSKFANNLNNLGNKFSNFSKRNKSETDENIKSTEEYRKAVMKLASEYKKMGMSASDALKKAHKELENMKSKTTSKGSTNNIFGGFNGNIVDEFSSKLNSIVGKFIAMQTASKGIQQMFQSGMEFQNARMFLNQAFGSESAGQEKFKFAQNFASETPFDTKEVANALARAKMLNLGTSESDFKMYSDLGSLAKLTGTGDLSSAIDAISDMQAGEFERLNLLVA